VTDEAGSVETQLALIRRDLYDLKKALFGNGSDKKGLVMRVEELAEAAERGRWALRVVLWLGGTVVAVMTALGQMRTALTALWTGHG
jgi:hypothetical protein